MEITIKAPSFPTVVKKLEGNYGSPRLRVPVQVIILAPSDSIADHLIQEIRQLEGMGIGTSVEYLKTTE